MTQPITDAELLEAGRKRFDANISLLPSHVCDNCGDVPACISDEAGTTHVCRRCYQAQLNYGRLHMPDAFTGEGE